MVATLNQSGVLPTVRTSIAVNSTESETRDAKKRRANECKQQLAVEAQTVIRQLEVDGWSLVFADGSAKHNQKIGWVAGFGCVWMGHWETKGFLHPSMAQTNNRAELQAAITVLEHSVRTCD